MFNQNLRGFREQKEITQTQMAALLKIPVTTYRNYENTAREPSFDLLIHISEILEVSVDKLLGNDSTEGNLAELLSKIKSLPKPSVKELENYIDYLLFQKERSTTKAAK